MAKNRLQSQKRQNKKPRKILSMLYTYLYQKYFLMKDLHKNYGNQKFSFIPCHLDSKNTKVINVYNYNWTLLSVAITLVT